MTKVLSSELYIRLFEELSPERLTGIETFVSKDIIFKDPFNELSGINSFRSMLVKLLDDVRGLKFRVIHRAWSGEILFLRWSFEGEVRGLKNWKVEGVSEISFNEDGLVCHHIDHWDAAGQFFEKLPIVGKILKLVRNRMRVS